MHALAALALLLAQAGASAASAPPPPGATGPGAGKVSGKVTLDQKQCEFVPHVVALPAGATLDIVNGDKVFHNVHARDGDRTVFNYAMPVPNHVIPKPLKQPALLRVTCDVHPWMRAWVDVLPTTAFAVTDEAGSYTISNVPPGKYTLRLWHERLGEKDQQVEVKAGGTASMDLQLTPR